MINNILKLVEKEDTNNVFVIIRALEFNNQGFINEIMLNNFKKLKTQNNVFILIEDVLKDIEKFYGLSNINKISEDLNTYIKSDYNIKASQTPFSQIITNIYKQHPKLKITIDRWKHTYDLILNDKHINFIPVPCLIKIENFNLIDNDILTFFKP